MRTNLVDGCVDGGVPCLWISHGQHNLLTGTRIRLEDDSQMKDLPLHPGRPSWSVCSAWRRGSQHRRHSSVQRRTVSTLQEESTIMENGQFCKYWPTLHCVDGCNNTNIVLWSFSSFKLPDLLFAGPDPHVNVLLLPAKNVHHVVTFSWEICCLYHNSV